MHNSVVVALEGHERLLRPSSRGLRGESVVKLKALDMLFSSMLLGSAGVASPVTV